MRIGIVTREWPPDVYGGAGVHIEHLVAAMRTLPAATSGGLSVDVHCFGAPRADATAHPVPANLQGANMVSINLMNAILQKADIEGTDFTSANLFRVDFAKARGKAASVKGALLIEVKLSQREAR